MNIEMLNRKTVKIFLSSEDMEDFALTCEGMGSDSPNARGMLLRLLKSVEKAANLDFSGGKLYIEVFPVLTGGCILYIVSDGERPNRNEWGTPLVFRLEGLRRLENVCGRLYRQVNHLVLRSHIYRRDSQYFLVVYTYFKLDNKIIAIAGEFGVLEGRGEVKHAQIREFAEPVADDNAVERIAGCT